MLPRRLQGGIGEEKMISRNANKGARDEVLVTKNELTQLLFWATVGVENSKSGSYGNCIEDTVREVGRLVGFKPRRDWSFKKR